jgi:Cu/Ag efflux protein CusF
MEMRTARVREVLLLSLAACLCLAGCGRSSTDEKKPATYYFLKGQVVAVDPASSLITVAHEDIPGFMKAMTMPFTVNDTTLFRGVAVGDSIRGIVVVQRPEMWLDSIAVVWKMPSPEPSR